ncbi:hypothetical protein U5N28_02700 [Lysinibacillus telephonicus]|uniref:Uncharacterized protein n=1 Tax=Lysinibacillus telephonicus TaxID=1714840 RepID=A0A3S0HPR7_9BACI|nr:hypothetical protein [Lysinibacillus telephonicus]RTQ95756.1 hypothetical protein EKG35_01885 [Lysinibacillus telephonicus]
MTVLEKEKPTFKPSKYLSNNDREKLRLLELAILQSESLSELKQYEKELERLIKKAYLRKKRRISE